MVFFNQLPGFGEFDWTLLVGLTTIMTAAGVWLFIRPAPYGKFNNNKVGWMPGENIHIDGRLGFCIQEMPSSLVPLLVYYYYYDQVDSTSTLFLILWQIHYFHRAFIYTFVRMKAANDTNLTVVAMAFVFTAINGYLNMKAAIFKEHTGSFIEKALTVLGMFVFAQGWALNFWADHILLNLRKPGDKGYYIPSGPPYRFISCPNYLGEITEWVGMFIAFRTWASASFILTTCANLVPRSLDTHRWYLNKFGDKYPKNRKALIPHVL